MPSKHWQLSIIIIVYRFLLPVQSDLYFYISSFQVVNKDKDKNKDNRVLNRKKAKMSGKYVPSKYLGYSSFVHDLLTFFAKLCHSDLHVFDH